MRPNLPMLVRRVRRVTSRQAPPITALARESWTLCPEEQRESAPAVHLPGAIEKVTALSPWRSWDTELELIRGGKGTHSASTAHVIADVDLVGAHLYKGPAKAQPGFGPERLLQPPVPLVDLDEATLVTSPEGSHFFGPLLQCDFPLELIAPNHPSHFAMVTRPYEHAAGYRRLLGLPDIRCLQRARVRELTMYVDFAQNTHKTTRYLELRRRLRANVQPQGRAAKRGVYLQRGRTGELRVLENEAELVAFLDGHGFEIVEPARLSAAEIAARTLDAPLVISVEGSHLSHAIFTLADRGTMLVLQPPDRFAMPYKEYTDAVDMRFAFLVGEQSPQGFRVPLDDVQRMLEELA